MKANEMLDKLRSAVSGARVYGEPYEKDGVTIITASAVSGGGGGGYGLEEDGEEGAGGGFGLRAHPAGAYVLKGGELTWRPAPDPNRIVAIAGLVAIVYLITRSRIRRAQARAM